MAELKKVFTERRRGPDVVVKAVWWTVGVSWVLIVTALMFTGQAQPKSETFFDRLLKVSVRNYWDENLLRYAFYVLLLNLAACIIGFVLNILRQKRKTDRISKSIIILSIVTLSGILWYMIR